MRLNAVAFAATCALVRGGVFLLVATRKFALAELRTRLPGTCFFCLPGLQTWRIRRIYHRWDALSGGGWCCRGCCVCLALQFFVAPASE